MELSDVFGSLLQGEDLGELLAESLFNALLTGELDEAQIAGVLALMQAKGPTVGELIGAARVMRRNVTPVPARIPDDAVLIDTCGTGGAPKTFNVSTAAAILAASVDPPTGRPRAMVAKHGNRSRTGRGSAEVLAEMGVNLDAAPELQARCLEEAGVCFSFAVRHHPAMKHAVSPRRSLAFPTVFNLLGPLTNPAGATRQLIGVYAPHLVPLVGGALAGLGAERAIVAHGDDGLDELTTCAPTTLSHVEAGSTREETIDAADLGLPRATHEMLRVSDASASAELIRAVVSGTETGPTADIAHLNAAAALLVAGTAASFAEGVELSRSASAAGRGAEVLSTLGSVSRG